MNVDRNPLTGISLSRPVDIEKLRRSVGYSFSAEMAVRHLSGEPLAASWATLLAGVRVLADFGLIREVSR